MTFEAAIWIDPARRSGEPCLNGTRLTVDHVATCIAAEGSVDAYIDNYDLHDVPRRSVLCAAAWWVLNARGRLPKFERQVRDAWTGWAEQVWADAWHVRKSVELPDPPGIEQEAP